MSSPRYTCMESTEMISPLSASATRSATSDLPDAVGPASTSGGDSGGFAVIPSGLAFAGLRARQEENQQQTAGNDDDADDLRGRGPAAKIVHRVIAAEIFHESADQRVADEIDRKDFAVEFPAAEQPGEKRVKAEV